MLTTAFRYLLQSRCIYEYSVQVKSLPRCVTANELSLVETFNKHDPWTRVRCATLTQVSLSLMLKANRSILFRFLETRIRSAKCIGKVRAHFPLVVADVNRKTLLFNARVSSVVRSFMVEARGQDGGLGAPKTQVSPKYIPHPFSVTDAN